MSFARISLPTDRHRQLVFDFSNAFPFNHDWNRYISVKLDPDDGVAATQQRLFGYIVRFATEALNGYGYSIGDISEVPGGFVIRTPDPYVTRLFKKINESTSAGIPFSYSLKEDIQAIVEDAARCTMPYTDLESYVEYCF